MTVPLSFEGIKTNEDGLIAEEDLMNLLLEKIGFLNEVEKTYENEAAAEAA